MKNRIVTQTKQLNRSIKHFDDEIASAIKEKNDVKIYMDSLGKVKPSDSETILKQKIETQLQSGKLTDLDKLIETNKNKKNYVEKLQNSVNELDTKLETEGIDSAIKYLDNLDAELRSADNTLLTELPDIKQWRDEVLRETNKLKGTKMFSSMLTSQNIESDKKFLKEFARMRGLDENVQKSWMENLVNKQKMAEFELPDKPKKYRDMFRKIKEDTNFRSSFAGLMPRDIAQKLKLPAMAVGTIAAAGGAFKIFNWFSSSSPENVGVRASTILQSLQKIGPTGPALIIINNIKDSLNIITTNGNAISNEFGDNPSVTMSDHLPKIAIELSNISTKIADWDIVANNCINKEEAARTKSSLIDLINDFDKKTDSLGTIVNEKNIAPSINSNNIMKVQNILKQLDPTMETTGNLDKKTIMTLQRLEKAVNKLTGEDNRFIGKFVNPDTNYVISYDDLNDVFNMMKRY